MTSWQRPSGPLNVWSVVDGYETLKDGTKKPVKFSIQDVPNEEKRRKEVLDHMFTYFLAEEPLSKCTKIKQDPEGAKGFQAVWQFGLDQGVVIACYKVNSEGQIGELVGANMLFIYNDATAEHFEKIKSNFKSENIKKIWALFEKLAHEADVRKIYNVDTYISSISLSVAPEYRGQKLGCHILNARSAMAKKYGLTATSTMFTAEASQIQAKRAGFEEGSSMDYADCLDDKGNPQFPGISAKSAKIMMRRLP